jgi:hypothetical protein
MYEGRYRSSAYRFFPESVIATGIKFTWVTHKYFAIIRLFFHKVSVILNTLLPTLSTALCTSVNIPCLDFGALDENFVSIRCHLQNGVRELLSSLGQRDDSRRVPDPGCEQDGAILQNMYESSM